MRQHLLTLTLTVLIFGMPQAKATATRCEVSLGEGRGTMTALVPPNVLSLGRKGYFDRPHIIVVQGPSSSGKTFLMSTWLLPELSKQGKQTSYNELFQKADVMVIDGALFNGALRNFAVDRFREGESTILITGSNWGYQAGEVSSFVTEMRNILGTAAPGPDSVSILDLSRL